MPILEMTLLDDDLYQDRHSPSGHRPNFDSVNCTVPWWNQFYLCHAGKVL